MDLTGVSENPVDEKGRVSLPTIFRKPLSDENLVIVRSNDPEFPHLRLYALDDYNAWIERYFESDGGYKDHLLEHQRKLAALKRGAKPIKIDASYRIRLENDLREYAGITDKVRFNGVNDFVMVIAPEVDDKYDDFVTLY
ncbi:MAG: hypothetical protein FWH40_07225 [Coriobacteriia bacterium]|nr:hypothetical protein [Coriobacteriia bacterium]